MDFSKLCLHAGKQYERVSIQRRLCGRMGDQFRAAESAFVRACVLMLSVVAAVSRRGKWCGGIFRRPS